MGVADSDPRFTLMADGNPPDPKEPPANWQGLKWKLAVAFCRDAQQAGASGVSKWLGVGGTEKCKATLTKSPAASP